MPIPDYQTIMLPLLIHLSDGKEKSTQETIEALSLEFKLTDQEKRELLPSGNQTIFKNRIAWAKAYLKKAGLIESPERGFYKITNLGLETLKKRIDKIDNKFLSQFKDFQKFVTQKTLKDQKEIIQEQSRTPLENLEDGYQKIKNEVVFEMLEKVKGCSPDFFERLVIELLLKMGYGGSRKDAGEHLGMRGDEGIDGIIKEDKLGLDIIYIQAKRWGGVIGRPEIQKFAGALQGKKARKGVFITTGKFSKEAESFANSIENKIVLIDGDKLVNLMFENDIGFATTNSYTIKKIDSDFFFNE